MARGAASLFDLFALKSIERVASFWTVASKTGLRVTSEVAVDVTEQLAHIVRKSELGKSLGIERVAFKADGELADVSFKAGTTTETGAKVVRNVHVGSLLKALRVGDVEGVSRMLGGIRVSDDALAGFSRVTREDVESLAKLDALRKAAPRETEAAVDALRVRGDRALLSEEGRRVVEGAEENVRKSGRGIKVKTFMGFTMAAAVVGGAAAGIYTYVNGHRRRISGCIRYSRSSPGSECRAMPYSNPNAVDPSPYNVPPCVALAAPKVGTATRMFLEGTVSRADTACLAVCANEYLDTTAAPIAVDSLLADVHRRDAIARRTGGSRDATKDPAAAAADMGISSSGNEIDETAIAKRLGLGTDDYYYCRDVSFMEAATDIAGNVTGALLGGIATAFRYLAYAGLTGGALVAGVAAYRYLAPAGRKEGGDADSGSGRESENGGEWWAVRRRPYQYDDYSDEYGWAAPNKRRAMESDREGGGYDDDDDARALVPKRRSTFHLYG